MRHLFKLVPILLFLKTSESLDSETNEPTYKFGIIAGEPDSLNASTQVTVSSFEECVQKCEEDVECILASQVADSEPCNLFGWNTVVGVKKNESGGEGQVAFRLFTNQPACELNLPLLLNGKTYQLFANNTEEYLWRIDTSEEGYTITYIGCNQDDSLVCGNWSFNRPYSDGCNPECNVTMVQVYAIPGPLTLSPPRNTATVGSWYECMTYCFNKKRCVVAQFIEGTTECKYWGLDDIYFLEKKTATDGTHMVIKLPVSKKSCFYTTEQLLNDNYYLAYPNILAGMKRQFFRVRTNEKYYIISNYIDENGTYTDIYVRGCPANFQSSWRSDQLNKTQMCERPFIAENISQTEAKELCSVGFGGFLLPERCANMTKTQSSLKIWLNRPISPGWGMQDKKEFTVWMGLEMDPNCTGAGDLSYCNSTEKWKWSRPDWAVLNNFPPPEQTTVAMTWGDGEPGDDKNKTCAYMKVSPSLLPFGYEFHSDSCDSTEGIDGFVCGTDTAPNMGIEKYQTLADEYEVDQDCCALTLEDIKEGLDNPF